MLRFANVYGPYSDHKNSVVAQFFKDITKGELTLDGDGEQTRDFIYVADLCSAISLSLKSELTGEVFQIATGIETSIKELASQVQEIIGQPVTLASGPTREGDVKKSYSGIRKANEFLGWQPQFELRTGLEQTWQWFQGQKNRKPNSSPTRQST